MMSLFFGSHVVKRDYENRKAFLVLSRPVSVLEFVTGKFFGVLALLVVIQIVLYPVVLGFYLLTGGDLSLTLFREVFLCFVLQGLLGAILISISIFFSSFSTSQLAFVCTFGLYFIGVNYSQIQFLASKGIATNALKLIELIVPNLEAFVRSHELAYSIPISSQLMMGLFGYAACFSSMALIPSSWIFSRREA
jgi:ABC-type transport system involved in multi-copper enzyme maturation permease subunit